MPWRSITTLAIALIALGCAQVAVGAPGDLTPVASGPMEPPAARPVAGPPARVAEGVGISILSIDGVPGRPADLELAPGPHRIRFDSVADASPPGGRPQRIHEVCEARFDARPGALYTLVHELVSVRGRWSWRHLLSNGVLDEDQDRWVGECVCRAAPE